MAVSYLDKDGLLYFWQKIKGLFAKKDEAIKSITRSGTTFTATRADGTTFTFTQQDNSTWTANSTTAAGYVAAPTSSNANKVWKTDANGSPAWRDDANTTYGVATPSANGLMSSVDKTKLNGIDTGAEVNQNAFSNVKVGSTTVAADSKTDTLELVAGSNVTLTPDATNDKVTIAAIVPTVTLEIDCDTGSLETTGTGFQLLGDGVVYTYTDGSSNNIVLIGFDLTKVLLPSAKGAANGVCPLNASSKIDSTYLPSYVDDVIEAYPRSGQTELSSTWLATGSTSGAAITPETGKIYVLMADSTNYAANTQFRWGGSSYVKLSDGGVSSITNAEIDTIVAA